MRASRFFIHTLRGEPAEAELASHRLMLRAGFVRRLASGIYSWLPAGWRAARKVADIVREEMDAAGAAEVFLPAVQPTELWRESGRLEDYGPELLRFPDRHGREFCLGPTHEEVVTEIVRAAVDSYRQLPFNLYQIQTKFRDEIRPRFGIMRAREFLMKDAYSFDIDADGMRASYERMRAAYCRIFDRIGLRYRMVEADSGAIGGSHSHEFVVLARAGEEEIVYCDEERYAANVDRARLSPPPLDRPPPGRAREKIATPGVDTIASLADFLRARGDAVAPERNVKTMIVEGDSGMAAILLRGADGLNLKKCEALAAVGANARLADLARAQSKIGAGFGSLGPVAMPLPVVADYGLLNAADFACGANEDGFHYVGVNFGRDCEEPPFADLRFARAGDVAPQGGLLRAARGIEVGHIFQLGDKYSRALDCKVDSAAGAPTPILMGCYGIGVTRIVAAAIEQSHDDAGPILPPAIAPFAVAVAPIGWGKSETVRAAAEKLWSDLNAAGIDALLDDRGLRPGVMFAELDLLGIPHRLVVGDRGLAAGEIEHKSRATQKVQMLLVESAVDFMRAQIAAPPSLPQQAQIDNDE